MESIILDTIAWDYSSLRGAVQAGCGGQRGFGIWAIGRSVSGWHGAWMTIKHLQGVVAERGTQVFVRDVHQLESAAQDTVSLFDSLDNLGESIVAIRHKMNEVECVRREA